jgi:hypothetical protein
MITIQVQRYLRYGIIDVASIAMLAPARGTIMTNQALNLFFPWTIPTSFSLRQPIPILQPLTCCGRKAFLGAD